MIATATQRTLNPVTLRPRDSVSRATRATTFAVNARMAGTHGTSLVFANDTYLRCMYEYTATVARVVDGDTVILNLTKDFELAIDFGFYVKDVVKVSKSAQIDFRLLGINTPEMRSPTLEAGKAAKSELERLLSLGTIRVLTSRTDKYGRWLADIYVTGADGVEFNVNQKLVEGGFAVPYMT